MAAPIPIRTSWELATRTMFIAFDQGLKAVDPLDIAAGNWELIHNGLAYRSTHQTIAIALGAIVTLIWNTSSGAATEDDRLVYKAFVPDVENEADEKVARFDISPVDWDVNDPLPGRGNLGKSMDALRELLANSTEFQRWTWSATVAAAKSRIILTADELASPTRPFAIIRPTSFSGESIASPNTFEHSGSISLEFEANVNPLNPTDVENQTAEFRNRVAKILDEMENNSGGTDMLSMLSFATQEGIQRSGPNEQSGKGDFFVVTFDVDWRS